MKNLQLSLKKQWFEMIKSEPYKLYFVIKHGEKL